MVENKKKESYVLLESTSKIILVKIHGGTVELCMYVYVGIPYVAKFSSTCVFNSEMFCMVMYIYNNKINNDEFLKQKIVFL